MFFQVLLLDIDTMIVQNIDELFEKDKVVLYTEDLPMDPHHHNAKPPMQGGFFLVKPGPESDKVYDDIVKIMEDGNFNAGSGWNNSRIGYHWGGAAVQGVYVVPHYTLAVRSRVCAFLSVVAFVISTTAASR